MNRDCKHDKLKCRKCMRNGDLDFFVAEAMHDAEPICPVSVREPYIAKPSDPTPTPLDYMHAYKDKFGFWEPYPGHPVEDWRFEVANDDTRIGYWEWVEGRLEQEMHDET